MPTETYELPSLAAAVRLLTGPSRPAIVEVEYEGTAPPVALFSHLGVVGFAGMVPQPPPARAIQWTAPDGAPLTTPQILPYRAAAQGTLTGRPEDRERALDAARLILERLADQSPPGGTGEAAPGREPAAAAPPVSTSVTAPGAPPPASTSAAAVVDRAPGEGCTVEVLVDAPDAVAARAVLAAHGEVVDDAPTSWTSTMRYRGSIAEQVHRAVRFVVVVDPGAERVMADALSGMRIHSLRRAA